MSALQAIAGRAGIEALRGEAAGAAMMLGYDRGASLFPPDAVVRIPHIGAEITGREEIRAGDQWLQGLLDYFVQTTHRGTIQPGGQAASGRTCTCELIGFRAGRPELNDAIYRDRCRRTVDGWRFTERVCEVRYPGHSLLAGPAPVTAGNAGDPPAGNKSSAQR